MTDKRFSVFKSEITGLFVVNDNTHEFAFEGVEDAGTIMKLVGLLNNYIDENEQLKHKLQQQEMEYATDLHRLAEENEKLKEQIADFETSFDICKHYKEAYGTEIVKIKQTIKDMLENERTELGRSVLRQLWENIGDDDG